MLLALGTPVPAAYAALAADLKTATDNLETDDGAATKADKAATAANGKRDASEDVFDQAFGALGGQVQVTAKGVAAEITATGYDVRAEPNPVQSLDGVEGFSVTTTNLAGTFDFTWDRSKGEVNFELRGRRQTDPPGVYPFSKTTTKTRLRAGGFDSGVTYLFEIRAHGARELESPWSVPFPKIAS